VTLTSLASWYRNQEESNRAIHPQNFQKHVQLFVQLNISAGWGLACWVNSHNLWFRWKPWRSNAFFFTDHGNAYLKRNALRWKSADSNVVILIYLAIAANEAFFCDCYRNTGHFCSVERIKRFVNVHLYCIVSNVPSKGDKYPGLPELLRSEISFSRTCNIPKQWKSTQTRSYWMKCVFCSYFDKIVYLLYNSQNV